MYYVILFSNVGYVIFMKNSFLLVALKLFLVLFPDRIMFWMVFPCIYSKLFEWLRLAIFSCHMFLSTFHIYIMFLVQNCVDQHTLQRVEQSTQPSTTDVQLLFCIWLSRIAAPILGATWCSQLGLLRPALLGCSRNWRPSHPGPGS